MELEVKIKHFAYGISIMILLNRFLYICAECFHFSDIYKVLFFGVIGISALLLGLFKFHKGLSFGLVSGGIFATSSAWQYYHLELTELLQFIVLMIALSVVCFALYRLYKKS